MSLHDIGAAIGEVRSAKADQKEAEALFHALKIPANRRADFAELLGITPEQASKLDEIRALLEESRREGERPSWSAVSAINGCSNLCTPLWLDIGSRLLRDLLLRSDDWKMLEEGHFRWHGSRVELGSLSGLPHRTRVHQEETHRWDYINGDVVSTYWCIWVEREVHRVYTKIQIGSNSGKYIIILPANGWSELWAYG